MEGTAKIYTVVALSYPTFIRCRCPLPKLCLPGNQPNELTKIIRSHLNQLGKGQGMWVTTYDLRMRKCNYLGWAKRSLLFMRRMSLHAGGGKLAHQYIINSGQERKKGCVKWSWWGDLSPTPCWALLRAQYLCNHEIKQEKKCFSPFTRPLDCFIKPFE